MKKPKERKVDRFAPKTKKKYMPPIKQEPKLEEESGQESDEARSESYKQP